MLQHDPRVRLHVDDGRLFLKSTPKTFDVIILNLPEPQTAQINRFYTVEFFREAAAKLNTGGIVSFQLVASEDYITPTLASFLQCINRSLREVFPEVSTIPGGKVHFFASKQAGTLTDQADELLRRLKSRHLKTSYVREYYLPFRMSPDRMAQLAEQIRPQPDTPLEPGLCSHRVLLRRGAVERPVQSALPRNLLEPGAHPVSLDRVGPDRTAGGWDFSVWSVEAKAIPTGEYRSLCWRHGFHPDGAGGIAASRFPGNLRLRLSATGCSDRGNDDGHGAGQLAGLAKDWA